MGEDRDFKSGSNIIVIRPVSVGWREAQKWQPPKKLPVVVSVFSLV